MYKIRDREEVLKEYQRRYHELDQVFMAELGKEYDRYIDLLKEAETREQALEVFEKEIENNENNYRDNAEMKFLEGSTHTQYMEILANYGLIVFFRDNMLE